jgi:hypothetical protein
MEQKTLSPTSILEIHSLSRRARQILMALFSFRNQEVRP